MSWQRVRGHEALVEGFQRAVRRGRLAHAYLFTGPPGVGKRLFATELAKAILCEGGGPEFAGCDVCPACIQVEAGTHPDYFPTARPADVQEFPVELMRILCASFALKSARGHGKVVVVDDADDLNAESANCFLKTLEEPPPRSVLILIGNSPDRQLPTIVSRCQVLRFRPLAPEIVDDLLKVRGIEDAELRARVVRLSGGSPGLAEALADPALWEFRQRLLEGVQRVPLDPVTPGTAWLGFIKSAGKESAEQRRRASASLRLLIDYLDDALTVSVGGVPRRTDPEDHAGVSVLGQRLGSDRLLDMLDRCLLADWQIVRRVGLDLVIEALFEALAQKAA